MSPRSHQRNTPARLQRAPPPPAGRREGRGGQVWEARSREGRQGSPRPGMAESSVGGGVSLPTAGEGGLRPGGQDWPPAQSETREMCVHHSPIRKARAGSEAVEPSGPQFPHLRRGQLHPGRWASLPTVPASDKQPKSTAQWQERPRQREGSGPQKTETPPHQGTLGPNGGGCWHRPACTRWGPRAPHKPGPPHCQLQVPPPWVTSIPAPSAPARPGRKQGAVGRGGQGCP